MSLPCGSVTTELYLCESAGSPLSCFIRGVTYVVGSLPDKRLSGHCPEHKIGTDRLGLTHCISQDIQIKPISGSCGTLEYSKKLVSETPT